MQIAREIMRETLKRYDVPEETHVEIEEANLLLTESTADFVELRMTRLTGYGLDALYEQAAFRLPGQFLRDSKGIYKAIREGVDGMCRTLFGPHDGEGLP